LLDQLVHPSRFAERLRDLPAYEESPPEPLECKDGRVFEHFGRSQWQNDGPAKWVLCFRDVTDRRRTEELLRRSDARFRELIEHAPDGIAVHDGAHLAYVNPALARFLGYQSAEPLIGRSTGVLFHSDDRAALVELLDRLLVTGGRTPLREVRLAPAS